MGIIGLIGIIDKLESLVNLAILLKLSKLIKFSKPTLILDRYSIIYDKREYGSNRITNEMIKKV